jgi:hypothetical protein
MKSLARFLLAILLLLTPGWATAQADEPPLKVLFIGNSYTSVNDLPSLVAALAEAAGGRKIETGQHLVGGCTLERHVEDKKAIDKIREKKWDVVVLQDHSLGPILNRPSMHEHARILDAEIKKQGAQTVFYLTWARQHIPDMQEGAAPSSTPDYARTMYQMSGVVKATDFDSWCGQRKDGLVGGLNGGYFDIAKELSARVAPVGMAWKKAMAADPNLVLHQADKSHPNPIGSYLAACVFYATLLDKPPVGLPSELRKGARVLVQILPDEAKRLQEVAWQAVQEGRQRQAAEAVGLAVPSPADPNVAAKLKFDTYSGYFVSNTFEPDAAESIVVTTNQEQFDKVFGVAFVMNDNSHRLPKDAFESNVVVVMIKRGNAMWDFKVEGVSLKDGVVELHYTSASTKSDTATFACPLIASIPKGEYKAIQFVENGKEVKRVDIQKGR